jgi:pilus assembly protein CpaB
VPRPGSADEERVPNWRIISTIAAVVLAAIAGVVVWKYVSNADSRAEKNKHLVSILVAKNRIARGTTFEQILAGNDVKNVKLPEDSLPPNYILPGNNPALLAKYKGRVAATDIYAGTPIVADQFVKASHVVNPVAGDIPKGKEAITVSLDQTHSVGGFLTPGDKVNIILNLAVKDVTTNSGGDAARTTAFLLSGVKVIAVGTTTILPSTTPAAAASDVGVTTTTQAPTQLGSLITLEVTPRQAEQIVQATTVGTMYLSLDPPGFDPTKFTTPPEIVGTINLFDQPLASVQSTQKTNP